MTMAMISEGLLAQFPGGSAVVEEVRLGQGGLVKRLCGGRSAVEDE